MADRAAMFSNLERAAAQLEAFAALPVQNDRDQAGLIQAFEFTFELFWKTFQKLGPEAGLQANSPREALSVGAQLRLIAEDEAPDWARMLLDRNLTSHTYNAALAKQIVDRLLGSYLPRFRAALGRIRALQV